VLLWRSCFVIYVFCSFPLPPSTNICSQDVGLLELKLLDIFTSSTCPNEVGLKSGTKPWWILTWFPVSSLSESKFELNTHTHTHTHKFLNPDMVSALCRFSSCWMTLVWTVDNYSPASSKQGTNEQARCLSGVRGWMPPKWRQQLLIHLEVGDSKKNCPCKIQGVATGYVWAMYT
jgi:hypothetical protein